MKFNLKNGYIYISDNQGLPGSKISAEVVINGVEDFSELKLSYSINGGVYKPIEGNVITFTEEELKHNHLNLKIKVISKDSIEFFKVDGVPLTHAVLFGSSMDKAYPAIIQEMIRDNKQLRAEMKTLREDYKSKMLELIETFKIINEKGNIL